MSNHLKPIDCDIDENIQALISKISPLAISTDNQYVQQWINESPFDEYSREDLQRFQETNEYEIEVLRRQIEADDFYQGIEQLVAGGPIRLQDMISDSGPAEDDQDRRDADSFDAYSHHDDADFRDDPTNFWKIGLIISICVVDERFSTMNLFTPHAGPVQLLIRVNQLRVDLMSFTAVKYARMNGEFVIKPIHLSKKSLNIVNITMSPSNCLLLSCCAICNFVDYHVYNYESILWTDVIGKIRINNEMRAKINRMNRSNCFEPLRLVHISMEYDPKCTNGSYWHMTRMSKIEEEKQTVWDAFWPQRLSRYDDLRMIADDGYRMRFQSISNGRIKVYAPTHMRSLIFSAGPTYARFGIMSAVVYPRVSSNGFVQYFEPLVIGPLKIVALVTGNRVLNFIPKTWPPEIMRMNMRYQRFTKNINSIKPQIQEVTKKSAEAEQIQERSRSWKRSKSLSIETQSI